MSLSPEQAADRIRELTPRVVSEMNGFTQKTLRAMGGRLGSGMGLLLEALWGYHTSQHLAREGLEIAWIPDHQYNDFACVHDPTAWDPRTRAGELLRIEAKSMNAGADESKAHFDELVKNILADDLLVVIAWGWEPDGLRTWPRVMEIFVDRALPIAMLRDALHRARGGSFVDGRACPDKCQVYPCSHDGEPLNAKGNRERLHGPLACKPPGKTSHMANFGGLKRMLGTTGSAAQSVKNDFIRRDAVARNFVAFVERALR